MFEVQEALENEKAQYAQREATFKKREQVRAGNWRSILQRWCLNAARRLRAAGVGGQGPETAGAAREL